MNRRVFIGATASLTIPQQQDADFLASGLIGQARAALIDPSTPTSILAPAFVKAIKALQKVDDNIVKSIIEGLS